MTSSVLKLTGVEKTYPGTPPVRALRGVDLDIRRGESVAVVGPSGSGKSTLLHIMGTLDRPTSGEVEIAGRKVSGLSDRDLSGVRSRHIGFVFQAFHLLHGYSALDNVGDGLLYTGLVRSERRAAARQALGLVGLEHRLDHPAEKLSGGERQRVAIARSIVGRPSLLLADEPTGNLDSTTSDAIVGLLEELNSQGITVGVITHDMEVAGRFRRRIELMDGRVVGEAA